MDMPDLIYKLSDLPRGYVSFEQPDVRDYRQPDGRDYKLFGIEKVLADAVQKLPRHALKGLRQDTATLALFCAGHGIGKTNFMHYTASVLKDKGIPYDVVPDLTDVAEIRTMLADLDKKERKEFGSFLLQCGEEPIATSYERFCAGERAKPPSKQRPALKVFLYDEGSVLVEPVFRGRLGSSSSRFQEASAVPLQNAPELFRFEEADAVEGKPSGFPMAALNIRDGPPENKDPLIEFFQDILSEIDGSADQVLLMATGRMFFHVNTYFLEEAPLLQIGPKRPVVLSHLVYPRLHCPRLLHPDAACTSATCFALFVRSQLKAILRHLFENQKMLDSDHRLCDQLLAIAMHVAKSSYTQFSQLLTKLNEEIHTLRSKNRALWQKTLLLLAQTIALKKHPTACVAGIVGAACGDIDSKRELAAKFALAFLTEMPIDTGRYAARVAIRQSLCGCSMPTVDLRPHDAVHTTTQFIVRSSYDGLKDAVEFVAMRCTEAVKKQLLADNHLLGPSADEPSPHSSASGSDKACDFEVVNVALMRLTLRLTEIAFPNGFRHHYGLKGLVPSLPQLLGWEPMPPASGFGRLEPEEMPEKMQKMQEAMQLAGKKALTVVTVPVQKLKRKSVLTWDDVTREGTEALLKAVKEDNTPAAVIISRHSENAKSAAISSLHGSDAVLLFACNRQLVLVGIEMKASKVVRPDAVGKKMETCSAMLNKLSDAARKQLPQVNGEDVAVHHLYVLKTVDANFTLQHEARSKFAKVYTVECTPEYLCGIPRFAWRLPKELLFHQGCDIHRRCWDLHPDKTIVNSSASSETEEALDTTTTADGISDIAAAQGTNSSGERVSPKKWIKILQTLRGPSSEAVGESSQPDAGGDAASSAAANQQPAAARDAALSGLAGALAWRGEKNSFEKVPTMEAVQRENEQLRAKDVKRQREYEQLRQEVLQQGQQRSPAGALQDNLQNTPPRNSPLKRSPSSSAMRPAPVRKRSRKN